MEDLQVDNAMVLLARTDEGFSGCEVQDFIRPGDPVLSNPSLVKWVTINRPLSHCHVGPAKRCERG